MDTKPAPTPVVSVEAQAKQSAITGVMAAVEKKFGKGSLMRLSDDAAEKVDVIPTGSLSLDRAIGIGGYPRGRIVEVYGPESSGKTTLTLHAIAEVQKTGGVAAIIDAEHALDPNYARALGVRPKDLLISQPDYGEQALEIVDSLIQSSAVDMIVVDSVAALTPKAELDGEMGDHHVGLHARLMSQAMRKITATAHKHNVLVIFINQIRMKIAVLYGSPEVTTGGNALKFYASVRLDVRRRQAIKDGDVATGNFTEVKVVKNKMAPPFRTAEFEVMYGKGIDQFGDVINVGVELGVIEKAGAWFNFCGQRLGHGRDAAREYLSKNPDTFAKIVAAVYAKDLVAS